MKYEVVMSSEFKKGLKAAEKRGLDLSKVNRIVAMLANGETLPTEYKDHSLKGKYAGKRECHIEPDWLLIYKYEKSELLLLLFDTGTHSDLFKK